MNDDSIFKWMPGLLTLAIFGGAGYGLAGAILIIAAIL